MDGRDSQRRVGLENIILAEAQRDILADYAQDAIPNESCAILLGKIKENSTIISDIYLTENVAKSPSRFSISNEQLIRAYEMAKDGKDVVGIFHSHPDSVAYPSSTDVKFMQINPVAWVIYSVRDSQFRAFTADGGIKEIPIKRQGRCECSDGA